MVGASVAWGVLTGCQAAALALAPASTPTSAAVGLPTDVYPSPSPVATGVVLSLAAACPNPAGTEKAQAPPVDAVRGLLADLGSTDPDTRRRASDPAFWPVLATIDWPKGGWPPDRLGTPQPASGAPQADLLARGCGKELVDRSWWVPLCPGPCQDPAVARAASLTGHLYLIKRQGRWLVWAAK